MSGNSYENKQGGGGSLKKRPSTPTKQNEEFNLFSEIENASIHQGEALSASSSAARVPLDNEPSSTSDDSAGTPYEPKRSLGKVTNPIPSTMEALFSEALKTMVNEKPVVPKTSVLIDPIDHDREEEIQIQEFQRRKLEFDKVPSQLLIDLSIHK